MREWQYYVTGGVLATLTVAVLVWNYEASPLRGEVWLMTDSTDEPVATVHAYTLPSLAEVSLTVGADIEIATVKQKTLMLHASPAEDGTVVYLSKVKGVWQIFFSEGGTERAVTDTDTIKRDVAWADGGGSIAYAEIATSSTLVERLDPNAWSVVRMLRNGQRITVGNGIRPQSLVGSETAALTSRGVEVFLPYEEPRLIIASPVPVLDTVFAVAPGGQRIAWINPGDQSLQVFERTPAQTYTPMYVKEGFRAQGMMFSDDGGSLILSETREGGTLVVHLDLETGRTRSTTRIPVRGILSAWIP